MDGHITRWCSAPGCMMNVKIAKRHFFRFPREKDRWIEWIKACNRMDLMTLGPECTNRYYRLCHLHFQVEMLRNFEGRVYLSKEAVPSIFFKPIQAGSKSPDSSQLVSFVTIFLKPERKNRNSAISLPTSTESQVDSTKLDERGTAIVSPLQAVVFPRASVKNIPLAPSEVKSECDYSSTCNTSVLATPLNQDCTSSIASTTSLRVSLKENSNNEHIIDLTTDPLVPTTLSKTVSAEAITQEDCDRTPKRKYWHVLTQTPNTWVSSDSLSNERLTEKSKICVESPTAKRRRTLCAEDENHRANDVDQFKTACAKLLPRDSALLVSACIGARERRKTRKDFKDGQLALELFFMAPSAYQFYQPLCQLPTVHQLQKHISNWDMQPDLNDNVMNALRLKLKSLPATKRRCCLCANEMQLRPHLFYNLSRDRIVGFYNTGTEKRRSLARKALVLVARSLAGDWEQPVAYYFQDGAYHPGIVTRNLIFRAIIGLRNIGANVHALVTSMAPTFLRLSQQLDISAERPSFLVDDESVFYIFDVPRLMRTTRNVFARHELRFRDQKASWTDVELFFRRDSQTRLPLVPELSADYFEADKCRKTKTEHAVRILSSSVAAGLSAHIASGVLPLKAIGTMEFVLYFGRLYDILNCASTKTNAKELDQAFTGSAHEMCFLQCALDFLRSIQVIDANGACVKSVKCFDRWQVTINAVIQLWATLKEHLPSLRMRRLNQEGIERVFCCIRRQSGNRARLTPILFTRAFKKLVGEHLVERSDEDDFMANARKMLKRIASTSWSSASSSSSLSSSSSFLQADAEVSAAAIMSQIALNVGATRYRDIDLQLYEKSAFKRVCDFLLNECLRAHTGCNVCVAYVVKERVDSTVKNAVNTFSTYIRGLEDVFMRNFEEFSGEEDVGSRMLRLAQQIKYRPPCPDFPVDLLIKLFLRMRIYFTLLRHNKICRDVESRDSLSMVRL